MEQGNFVLASSKGGTSVIASEALEATNLVPLGGHIEVLNEALAVRQMVIPVHHTRTEASTHQRA